MEDRLPLHLFFHFSRTKGWLKSPENNKEMLVSKLMSRWKDMSEYLVIIKSSLKLFLHKSISFWPGNSLEVPCH